MPRLIWMIEVLCAVVMAASGFAAPAVIVVAPGATPQVELAAREVRRYVYLRTGELLPVRSEPAAGLATIRLTRDDKLAAQTYRLTTTSKGPVKTLTLAGGSDLAVLYAAYQFAETLGVRFYLHGDVIPGRRIPFALPDLNQTQTPLFATRGILPFHDFTEGPDWWDVDDYKAYLTQMAKLRMNMLDLHCYPDGDVGPEPLIWIGHPDDVDAKGKVAFSAPSRWASTNYHSWGHAPVPTAEFAAGAGRLFEEDDYGPAVTRGHRPQPATPAAANEVFERTGSMLRDAFGYGRQLGIGVAMGTETPLTIPRAVQARLREKGLDPQSPEVRQKVYEGMFARIARCYPIDQYLLWTPEAWTWRGASQPEIDATVSDIKLALAAIKAQGQPFGLGTSGWELGPKQDRSLFNNLLPKGAVMSCINRNIGFNWVDQEFVRIQDRPKWAIPWLEDDSVLVQPQLWAGRVRRDAADALAYGCTGLLGIHWRTKVLAPNVSALAQAGWSQSPWNPQAGIPAKVPKVATTDIRVGGSEALSSVPVANTEEDPVYQSCRFDMSAYRLAIPNGTYDVTLKFNEPAYAAANQRVFGVTVEGTPLVERLDVAARAGRNVAYDLTAKAVRVADEELLIEFKRIIENPFVCAIVIDGKTDDFNQFKSEAYSRRINCGGGKWQNYEADLPPAGELPPLADRTRDLSSADLYQDFAGAWFGPEVAAAMAKFFVRNDGDGGGLGVIQGRATLPRPTTWMYGPGAMVASRAPWAEESKRYAFVDELVQLRDKVKGAGERERFDYWLNTFLYLRAMAEATCVRGALDIAMEQVAATADPAAKKALARSKALPARLQLARAWETMITYLLGTTDTPGELGTIANLEQATRCKLKFVDGHDAALTAALGEPALPKTAAVSTIYQGAPRLIVPTQRSVIAKGESVALKVMVLDAKTPTEAALYWRALGPGTFRKLPLQHVARGVYQVKLPEVPAGGAEYHVRITTAAGKSLVWPATAPETNFTVVELPQGQRVESQKSEGLKVKEP